ncbi:DUF72 domain-containing protein [Caballeronia hypogeia]|uniref:DUF72 domain-containing protein n=1 Tax=Caballeronia hypogeia TaxID=1777140 RepID=UPI000772B498|nr:DUF72 domain-containing protein [Caballeronia hypogeia]
MSRDLTHLETGEPEEEQFDLFGEPAPVAAAEKPATQAKPPKQAKQPKPRGILPAPFQPEFEALASRLPDVIHLGTSTWSFPGWRGIVYGDEYSNAKLSRDGLTAYGAHPLLKSVSIDRSFYAPLSLAEYARYASQVPEHFRFIVKAPASVTDAFIRGERGTPDADNPAFLNAQIAIDDFVTPCIGGLGAKAGALVFQFSPLPDAMIVEPARFIDRLSEFLKALPSLEGDACYAVEIRDAVMLTPRFIRALREANARYCIGVHARMPDVRRQAKALAVLDEEGKGPLVVRWSLHSGFRYEQAKAKYEPFDKIVDEDRDTREALAELAAGYAIAGQPVVIAANNKAEGSAPLTCFELARGIAEEIERARNA